MAGKKVFLKDTLTNERIFPAALTSHLYNDDGSKFDPSAFGGNNDIFIIPVSGSLPAKSTERSVISAELVGVTADDIINACESGKFLYAAFIQNSDEYDPNSFSDASYLYPVNHGKDKGNGDYIFVFSCLFVQDIPVSDNHENHEGASLLMSINKSKEVTLKLTMGPFIDMAENILYQVPGEEPMYTVKHALDGLYKTIGDIDTILDTINGEVV